MFGLLLLVALLITLPGIRHPLPMLALSIFTILAWRTIVRWRDRQAVEPTLDDEVTGAAADWDARHGPPDDFEAAPESEAWRESLRPSGGWRDSADDDDI